MCAEYDLYLDMNWITMREMYHAWKSVPKYQKLLNELNLPTEERGLSNEYWDMASMYLVFAFRKDMRAHLRNKAPKPTLAIGDILMVHPPRPSTQPAAGLADRSA
eukprot:GEZU01024221.1.p3 GENE.GEZU01024221.1~~GEZU01024221.1.p3  ORF type:complete len:105 (-),score=30.00 GEZU01024221.1:96-410(-)